MTLSRRMFFGGVLGGAAATGITVDAERQPETMRPGDVLVIEHPGHLSETALDNIAVSAKQVVPEGVKVIVLEEGMRASLLRPQAIDLSLDGQAIGKAMVDAQRPRGAV
jgi:hypothetical protein